MVIEEMTLRPEVIAMSYPKLSQHIKAEILIKNLAHPKVLWENSKEKVLNAFEGAESESKVSLSPKALILE